MTIRVLVVDDDPAVRVTVGRALEVRHDIEVVGEAADGREAVALAQSVSADVIVMDHKMPVMTGLEATRRIREAGIDAPVLILSADVTVSTQIAGLDNVRFLSKDRTGPAEMDAAIRDATRGKRGRIRPPAGGGPDG